LLGDEEPVVFTTDEDGPADLLFEAGRAQQRLLQQRARADERQELLRAELS